MTSLPPRFTPISTRADFERCTDARENLETSLCALVKGYPPVSDPPDGFLGLFKGPSSVAYLFLRLSRLYQGKDALTVEGKECHEWCALYLEAGKDHASSSSTGKTGIFHEGLANLAQRASLSQDSELVKDFCGWASILVAGDDERWSNEWVNGRAGYLYLLRMVKYFLKLDDPLQKLLDDTATIVINRIIASSRPWKWFGTPWICVGAVHGIIGIITQVILTQPSQAKILQPEFEVILGLQRPDGEWAMKIPDDGDERFCQFCHGAPGVVLSLLSLKEFFPELKTRIDEGIRKGRDRIWERGLLTKEPCLCHGISGNGLALDRERFEKFMSLTTAENVSRGIKDGMYTASDAPWSLYCGEAGRAWCWAVADKGAEMEGRMIGYNDL